MKKLLLLVGVLLLVGCDGANTVNADYLVDKSCTYSGRYIENKGKPTLYIYTCRTWVYRDRVMSTSLIRSEPTK